MIKLIALSGFNPVHFELLADETPVPQAGAICVSLEKWFEEKDRLSTRQDDVAVSLPNTADVSTMDSELLSRPMIMLNFPAFPDGRAYSQARLLRELHAYKGDLRASGAAVVSDQIAAMARCGISTFQLREDQSLTRAQAFLTGFSLSYQPALPGDSSAAMSVRKVRNQRLSA